VRAEGRGAASCAKKPFGGIQLILCGDFAQLPPVQKGGSSTAARFLFQAKSWQECVQQQVLLRQAFRQSGVESRLSAVDFLSEGSPNKFQAYTHIDIHFQ